ncbi:MAG: L-idonate 5-dehydrogenase [Hyphomicrobiaceae bacterium]
MQAIVVHAPHDLRVEDIEAPDKVEGRDEVTVRIERGGICGSDLHYYHNGGFGEVRIKQPMVLGHEVSGTVKSVGADVKRIKQGDRVAVNPSRPCNTCAYCREGNQAHCLDMRFYGSAMRFPHVQGAFRDEVIADEAQCFKVLPSLTSGEAAMAEPLAVCLHAVNRAGSLVGKKVLITGSGPIGALCAAAARRAGAIEIAATDVAAFPLKMIEQIGADFVFNVAKNTDALKPFTKDKGIFDVLFEASGNEAALTGALDALRPGATIVQVGLGGNITLPMNTVVAKELVLKGTFRFHKEFETAVEMMNNGLIDVSPVISQTLPYQQATEAFDLASDRSKAMKVQLAFA